MESILLVDDEEVICAQLQRVLRHCGFRVQAAHTVEAALRKIQKARFDAILVEFNLRSERLPVHRTGNGLNLVHQLRTLQVEAPVLVFTAMEGAAYETASRDAGAEGFIPKTTPIPRLVSRLRYVCAGKDRS